MRLRCCGYSVLFAAACCVLTGGVHAQDLCQEPVGRLASIDGEADVQKREGVFWRTAQLDQPLCEGDTIRVGDRSRVAVQLINNAVLRIDQNTSIRLVNIRGNTDERSWLDLVSGAMQSFSRQPWLLKVTTPHFKGDIDGTEFYVQAEQERSLLSVLEGRVVVSNERGGVTISAGEAATAEAGKAPELRTVIRPRDAVQWALYYPPVLAVRGGWVGSARAEVPAFLTEAIGHAGRGNLAGAFQALDRVPDSDRDARFFLYRAAFLLHVGRVAEARTDIANALDRDPDAGLGYALRAIIHVVQNERDQALADAERAHRLSDTAAVAIALSYAQQANLQIEAARDTLLLALQRHADDALAWARLGELWLMLGDRKNASAAAAKAVALAPELARTQLVLGFIALAEFRNREARAAFQRAIELASSDPLAHLGLGLAKIAAGDLVEGRKALELAVALDSNNTLFRAYLGKAYFEERRSPLDADQYSLAKLLDPLDPTAYLYEGIRLQTEGRPVEALRDFARSIDLNDHRAVYRSRLLLDKDRAARETSLARAFRDLGFTQLGINQSTESLGIDPSNYSAHRFLSDSYLGVRRHEIARVSELLQAQLLQDINVYPVQPSIAETNLNILTIGGPSTPGFNEFTQLFEHNTARLDTTAFAGNNNTYGGEGVATALYNRFSLSAGAFYYNSDGWRPNNDLTQHIYDFFTQWAIMSDLNLQAEYRRRDSEEGDLAFNFDPKTFLRDRTVARDQDVVRVGLRYSPNPRSNLLLSFIGSDRAETRILSEPPTPSDPLTMTSFNAQRDDDGDQFEGQYIYQRDRFSLIAGLAYNHIDSRSINNITFAFIDATSPPVEIQDSFEDEIRHPRAYLYTNIVFPTPVTWTFGFSYDDYDEQPLEETSFNPKFGVQWRVTEDLRLRTAAFKVLKPALVNNRTIEPTQVAGINQFFDDIAGTESWRYGGGFDWKPTRDVFLGGEVTWRDLDEPVFIQEDGTDTVELENRDEQFHRLYLYWTPITQLGLSAGFVYDRYTSEVGDATELGNLPEEVESFTVPIAASYFHASGFFATAGGTYVDQNVRRSNNSNQGDGSDSFFLVDATVGYRLPKRLGLFSIGVKNLFDTEFEYQDDSFREFRDESSTGPYFPDRVILARISLNL